MTGKKRAAGAVWESNKKGGGEKATLAPAKAKATQGRGDARVRRAAARQAGRARAVARPGWAHEVKFDGYRLQLRVEDGKAPLRTRKGLDWTEKFSAIAKQAARAARLHDRRRGGGARRITARPISRALQAALSEGNSESLIFFAFDLLFADGEDLRALPLRERKARLKELLDGLKGKHAGAALRRAFRDGGRRGAGIGLPHASRRHRLQAARCALSLGPRRQLDQDQVPRRPRGGDRRLDQRGQDSCARCWSACIAARSWSMSAGSAPASARR